MDTVYYCSSVGGLTVIDVTALETVNYELICCTNKIASVLNFISKNNDFIFSVGKDFKSSRWFICERTEKGIFSVLKQRKLSIYQLKQLNSDFSETCWTDRVGIQTPSIVINEEIIVDLYEYLVECCRSSELEICWYPEKVNGIAEDDQDLVELAIMKHRIYGNSVLSTIKQYHPHLMDRVIKGIASEAFREYGI